MTASISPRNVAEDRFCTSWPEVPRTRTKEQTGATLETLQSKLRELETRLKLMEAEQRGTLDLSKLVDPEKLLKRDDDW